MAGAVVLARHHEVPEPEVDGGVQLLQVAAPAHGHLYTCTVHLYCTPVHGDLLQVHLAEPAQLHLLGPHVHTEVARSSLKVKSAVREELRISTFHPKLYTQYTYTIYTI